MKTLKFHPSLVPLVLSGEKCSTWRMFDDKNLAVGDDILLLESGQGAPFTQARIIQITEKSFRELTSEDKTGHESFASDEEMYKIYSGYYATLAGPDTKVKIIKFDLRGSLAGQRRACSDDGGMRPI